MKVFAMVVVGLVWSSAAQAVATPCGTTSPAAPCVIKATLTSSGSACTIVLNYPGQKIVNVPKGVDILWAVSGVGEYFMVALDYGSALFGSQNIFFKGGQGAYTGALVTGDSGGSPVTYYIYAVDPSGNKCVLDDPKVIVNPGLGR